MPRTSAMFLTRSFPVTRHFAALTILALGVLLGASKDARGDKGDGRIDPAVLKTVKKATAYLRVTLPDGEVVQGSGFFAVTPGLVLTNAHVLGMLRPESRKPTKVEVVLNSGEADERTLAGIVLGVDGGTDLGAILVRAKGLPEPLRVVQKPLSETDQVFIFGFPFGKELGKNVTVSKSSISSLRKDPTGKILEKIQVNGGMNPGNSGGPVVDEKGDVMGVSVSGIRSSTINFAIPSRAVHFFVTGRRKSFHTGPAYKDGERIKVPVRVEMIDPLGGIGEVWFDTWTGNPGKTRSALEFKPEPQPGDSAREKHVLVYKNGVATGEISFPAKVPAGKVLWFQTIFISGNKKTSWNSGIVYKTPPPVERKAALLKHRPQLGVKSSWKLACTSTLKLRDEDDVDHPVTVKLEADLMASTAKAVKAGFATTTLGLSKAEVILSIDNKPVVDSQKEPALVKDAALVSALLREKADGSLGEVTADVRRVPSATKAQWTDLAEQIVASLESVAVPLPGQELEAGKTWTASRPLTFASPIVSLPVVAEITYEYVGTRERNKREEAVVLFTGTVRGRVGKGVNVGGKLHGEAWIDASTGQVVLARNTLDIDLDATKGKQRLKLSGTLESFVTRPLPPADK